jgi:hypothetical protein
MVTVATLPSFDDATVVVPAPGDGPGNWAGAASAVVEDGIFWLVYRVRRPLGRGRGVAVVVARSRDGVTFEPVASVRREDFRAESFERPALVRRPDGGWRLYVSCATRNSKHWWVEALDADSPAELAAGTRTMTLPGSPEVAVKDPVVLVDPEGYRLWACLHPLDVAGHEDRMTTAYATSPDGLTWTWHGTALAPTPGSWDQRGARVTAVLSTDPLTVLYDGRARAEDNWHEVTGIARAEAGIRLRAEPAPSLWSPHSDGALRYVSVVPAPGGGARWYAEMARGDGAHDLVTVLIP